MTSELWIRGYKLGDADELRSLFYDVIHNVAIRDYSKEQVNAWAPAQYDSHDWQQRIERIDPFICMCGSEIVGYADLQESGLIDHFFVRWTSQRQGVGRALMAAIDQKARDLSLEFLHADVSETAKAFFEAFGFEVVTKQQVTIGAVTLDNFRMKKILGEH